MAFERTDKSILANWWWGINKTIFFSVLSLAAIGAIMIYSASPYIAERMGSDGYFFIKRYLVYAPISIAGMIIVSMIPVKKIKDLSVFGLFASIILLVATFFVGGTTKGASRWIDFGFFAIQPSEFIKPFFAIILAYYLSKGHKKDIKENKKQFKKILLKITIIFILIETLLLMQPDIGMFLTIGVILGSEIFIAGFPIWLITTMASIGIISIPIIYKTFPHFKERVNIFLNPENADTYQIDKAIAAIQNGGLFGTTGESVIKQSIPDAHTDFIYAVIMEEFGIIGGLALLAVSLFIILKILKITLKRRNLFILYSLIGLTAQFTFQTSVNIASTLKLIPTKGMTLPFISYGGSSYLSFAFIFGVILAFTRNDLKEVKNA